jgi:hypothetical protein
MSYIPHYQHDIFVCYAPVDDEPLVGADKGWVTTLITALKNKLGQKLGHADAYSLWMDYQLGGHESVTLAINEQLKSSATFLLILSPGYFYSSCRSELDTFLQRVGSDSKRKRIFVVEKDCIKHEQKPEELQKVQCHPFWVKHQNTDRTRTLGIPRPNPEREPEYYEKLDDLAYELTIELGNLKEQIELDDLAYELELGNLKEQIEKEQFESVPQFPSVSSPPTPKDTIFLAEVTDDLNSFRNQVKRYLEQQGLQVLPSTPYYFHTEADLRQALTVDLQKSSLFVQLLSDSMPQRPAWMTTPMLQWELAKQIQELTILQWHDSKLELGTVSDATCRALLAGSITGMTLGEFQQYVIQQLEQCKRAKEEERKRVERQQAKPLGKSVFVNTYIDDQELAEQIGELFSKHKILCFYPIPPESNSVTPQQLQEDLEETLRECDAMLIIYGNSPLSWVRSQLRQFFKIATPRQPIPYVAVCQSLPEPKAQLHIVMPMKVDVFDCCHQPLEDNLRTFISRLETPL